MAVATRGERMREARDERGLTRKALGKLAGVHGHTVYRWERGDSVPTCTALVKVAAALGVSAHWLETGEEAPTAPEAA